VDRLLDAALEVFNERTFADTTMEQIARRAGASTKTLYARYADKAAVADGALPLSHTPRSASATRTARVRARTLGQWSVRTP
jgi:AcrR family transcriptional regulator